MDKEALRSEIAAMLAEHLSMENAPGTIARDETPSWDSIKHLMLCFALEDKYSINLTQEEVVEINSSETITEIVFAKISARNRTDAAQSHD